MVEQDHADVALFLQHADDEALVFEGSYEDLAQMHTRTIVESVTMHAPTPPGKYTVGIRERGDEQYTQYFHISELVGANPDEADAELQNHVSAVLNHWRQ